MSRAIRLLVAAASLAAIGAAAQATRNARALPSIQSRASGGADPATDERISVLLPVRDEARNITSCLPSILAQEHVTEVLVLDDASTDGTPELAHEIGDDDPRLRVISDGTGVVPEGWVGKTWACERLAQLATGDVLVFVDADVVLEPMAVDSAIRLLRDLNLDMLCPYPRQQTTTVLTRLVQPLLQWSWLTFIPYKVSMVRQLPSMAVGNGQFAVFDATAYRTINGHAAVASEVLEDVALARRLRERGFRTAVVDGSAMATCRMYDTNAQLVDGYTKSLWSAFGSEPAAFAVVCLLKAIYVLPPVVAIVSRDRAVRRWALLGYVAGVAGRIVVAKRTQQRVLPDAATQPLSIIAFGALTALSIWRHRRGTILWKGRPLPGATS